MESADSMEICSEEDQFCSFSDSEPEDEAHFQGSSSLGGQVEERSAPEEPHTHEATEDVSMPGVLTARAYQQEMLEESLKRNIIVTMDTGSGKTQVAVLRIMAELERGEKRIWFLVPTVLLAYQQHDVLTTQIPSLKSRLLCGAHGVDTWTNQQIWDSVLGEIRVVVSTYQILFDAVSHGFVRLQSLSLIVIDEAHNCIKNNAVGRLMKEMYWRDKKADLPVPTILGLTASPLMRTNFDGLNILEATLDAVCKSPTKHRNELIAMSNRPNMHTIRYAEPEGTGPKSPTLASLERVVMGLNIWEDPWVLRLKAHRTTRNIHRLKKILTTRNTYSQKKMKSFLSLATIVRRELGSWAADYYIGEVVAKFLQVHGRQNDHPLQGLSDEERIYLVKAFRAVDVAPLPAEPTDLSVKAQAAINILVYHKEAVVGIIFVAERAMVAVLRHLLTVHPLTRSRYRAGSMVGTATRPGNTKDFLDLSKRSDLQSLQRFRAGQTNLLVATNVLEEGIDVPVCNLVVCFDAPKTPKSFIQRRGRARMLESDLYILIPEDSDKTAETWQAFEDAMKAMYEDELRAHKTMQELELESTETADYPVLEDETTGARLTIRDAKQHLEHFCSKVSSKRYGNTSPYYTYSTLEDKTPDLAEPSLMRATVCLPASLVPELRRFQSLRAWYSQEIAGQDAAFQAYKKLYEIGLVNKNFLPEQEGNDQISGSAHREGLAKVSRQLNPWLDVARLWREADGSLFSRRLTIANTDGSMCADVDVVLPVSIPPMLPFKIYRSPTSYWSITPHDNLLQTHRVETSKDHTDTLLDMAFGHRRGWTNREKQYPLKVICADRDISIDDIGVIDISPERIQGTAAGHLIRDHLHHQHPYIFHCWLPSKPARELVGRLPRHRDGWQIFNFETAPENAPYISVHPWPKKSGQFRRPWASQQPEMPSSKPYPRILPAEIVKMDAMPAVYPHIGLLIPAILYTLGVHLVAADLTETLLERVGITDVPMVVTAISTVAADGPTDYEAVEFLGDTILKFCTTVNVSSKHLQWPEGYLSRCKDKFVSNSNLCRAAIRSGLDKYIILDAFVTRRPVYIEDLLEANSVDQMQQQRTLSTKTLADVIEAIIGTSYLAGGIPKALACMSLFLPEGQWQNIEACRQILFDSAPSDEHLPLTMSRAEELLGYTFKKKSLLVEALTHTSCNLPGTGNSLERLEFLGDAVLDYLITTTLHKTGKLENWGMHLLRTALVNAEILAFFVMEWTVDEARTELKPPPSLTRSSLDKLDQDNSDSDDNNSDDDNSHNGDSNNGRPRKQRRLEEPQVHLQSTTAKLSLWSFMRHTSSQLGVLQKETQKRHAKMRDEINEALRCGTYYPWSLLARLQVQKLYSDIFESVLGAVWTDSGDMGECMKILERAGILSLMERLLSGEVYMRHPKEELTQLVETETARYGVEAKYVEDGPPEYDGWVVVGDRRVSHVHGCITRDEARVRAAEEACKILKQERTKRPIRDFGIKA